MLKLKYLFENYDLAKKALENWEHDGDTLDDLLSRYRISSNAIYPFKQEVRLCFLRIAPTEEKLERNVFGELEFIGFLNGHGYPALKPVVSKSGDNVLKLSTQWGEYYASVFEKVVGKQIGKTDYADEIMYAYGVALGKLHALSAGYVPKIRKWTHGEVLEWIEQMACVYHAPSFVLAEIAAVKVGLSELPVDAAYYGLVHYDFEPDNVFYDKDTKSCFVIDFDDGMYHWFALDIAQVFDSLASELDGDRLGRAKAEFMRGYRVEFDFSDVMEGSLPIMRRFCNLYRYARIIRSVDEWFEDEPDWMAGLRERLERVVRRLELDMQ